MNEEKRRQSIQLTADLGETDNINSIRLIPVKRVYFGY